MASGKALDALRNTRDAIQEIQVQLQPFLEVAEKESSTAMQRAQAQAAIALSLGTLRYMGARLRGVDQGRNKDDPLRQELDQMRKLLVALQKKQQHEEEKQQKRDELSKQLNGGADSICSANKRKSAPAITSPKVDEDLSKVASKRARKSLD
jgi:hypothetical protein